MSKSWLWRALKGYAASRMREALCVLACAALIVTVCALLSAPLAGVMYGLALGAFLGLCLAVPDLARFLRVHAELERLLSSPLTGADELPEPRGVIERDYDALVRRLSSLRAKEIAERADEKSAQSDYYALWAHQIKVPISAMKLLLRDRPDGARLGAELLRVEQYVDMALGYERLTSRATDYVLREIALAPVIRQTARRFAPLFIQKKLKLELRDADMTALTDEKWLAFVLEQLLSNAVKYTRSGGTVTVRCESEASLLIVEDTGIGIASEDLPRVFEQGYTGYNGRADKRATGLGLYLCKRALDRLGHTISIQSELNRGTRVTIDLSSERPPME